MNAPQAGDIEVVAGSPTADELTAIVTVLTARLSDQPTGNKPVGLWANKGRLTRPQLSAGPGAWRASALPR